MRPSTSALSLQFSSGGGSATKLRPEAPLVDDKQSPRTVVVGHLRKAPHRAPHTHTPSRTYHPEPAGPSTISPPLLQKRGRGHAGPSGGRRTATGTKRAGGRASVLAASIYIMLC
mmetsp:Transcript_46559/g.90970  ORF Transcript_46559/g.90970 Transcript_46559/m.90970 type:complete len:115 (+) Transcript_46559:61-405(+)